MAVKTADIIRLIRDIDENVGIIATGGKTEETIGEAIEAGATAISFTPPSTGELFKNKMTQYRNEP